jgi:ADP-heptose:LPS heptosyltransferase
MIGDTNFAGVRKVLIFLLGSLGDTVVALPALRLIARRFPQAQRCVLTNFSVSEKAAPMSSLLDGDLIHDYIRFPPGRNEPLQLLKLAITIRRWNPDLLVYLHEPRGRAIAARDAVFFRVCGIRRTVGYHYVSADHALNFDTTTGQYEHRTDYLARRLSSLGDARPGDRSSWDLALSKAEADKARTALSPLLGCSGILSASIGAKVDVKDWGDGNWTKLFQSLSARLPGWGLAMIGAPSERERSQNLLAAWQGKSVNLCGSITLRECGAALSQSDVYVGHDSGPMHLAAAVGTPCVAIFSARNLPGEWFPYGEGHTVLYHQTECFGCRLSDCPEFAKKCILSISVETVAQATLQKILSASGARQREEQTLPLQSQGNLLEQRCG